MDEWSLTVSSVSNDMNAKQQPSRGNDGALAFNLLILALGLFLCSCAPVGPNFNKPEIDAPAQWSEPEVRRLAYSSPRLGRWWEVFDDPVLNNLVSIARKNNNTLEIAGLRVLETRAQLGVAVGTLYPQSQSAVADATYISPPGNSAASSNFSQYNLGLTVGWEIDFWGRFRRGIESADAAFMASMAAYDQALVLLTSLVVDTYAVVRILDEQIRYANENVKLQQQSYDIAETLYRNGETSELDMQQAYTLLLSTRATVPGLEIKLKQTRNALSTLLGWNPGRVNAMLEGAKGIPMIPADISIGFPADMLRRRPDVRRAEMLAMSQNALVGATEADLYPRISLIGGLGLTAGGLGTSNFGDLFGSGAFNYAIGPSLVWPIFNYGRIKNRVRVQDARLQQALVNYRETVIQAAREAENAMAGFIGALEQKKILAETVTSAKRSSELSTLRYSEGFSDYQRVLESQRALFIQQQRYIVVHGSAVTNLVALYKSLGGGWEERPDGPYIAPKTLETMQNRTDWGKLINGGFEEPDSKKVLRKIDW
jgi:NodT family efflux transporter outer membrane factor (OMF) lipoprotein